jgi:hypothetical protein
MSDPMNALQYMPMACIHYFSSPEQLRLHESASICPDMRDDPKEVGKDEVFMLIIGRRTQLHQDQLRLLLAQSFE